MEKCGSECSFDLLKAIVLRILSCNLNEIYTVFEIRGFRLSELTKYSDGQPQLAKQLSGGKPALISGTIQHTKMVDHSLERV